MNIHIITFETIDSTNTEALKQARLGADEGLCIVARQQTAGRGRHGRPWVSEKDAGLYFSIVLRPKIETRYLPLITLMTGVAVHSALAEFGIDADIKWVNDLLVGGKKICGILAETADTPEGLAVIVGIGINIRSSNFPPEIAETATSIQEHQESMPLGVSTADVVTLTQTLTRSITYFYDLLHRESGPANIIDAWRERSSYFSGKPVRVMSGGESLEGITDGLESNGALRLKLKNGVVTIIQAGDVEQVRAE
jgi:BirA family biotin operon repressor/biotin-[acetyl-CoA-carboxylase] ligase